VQAPVEIVREGFRLISEVGSSDALKKQRVTGKNGELTELVHRRTLSVTGHAHRGHREFDPRDQFNGPPVSEGLEVKGKGVRWIEPEGGAGRRTEFSRAAQVVRVQMGVKHVGDSPTVFARDPQILLELTRWVDHDCGVTGSDQVGEASLAATADLDDRCAAKVPSTWS